MAAMVALAALTVWQPWVAADPAARLIGSWRAQVRYSWGDSLEGVLTRIWQELHAPPISRPLPPPSTPPPSGGR
jgi:hypothetical protein